MSFDHNDIVTKYVMDAAISEGGGGGGSSVPILIASVTGGTINKTAAELLTAFNNGLVFLKKTDASGGDDMVFTMTVAMFEEGHGYLFAAAAVTSENYTAANGTDYPTLAA